MEVPDIDPSDWVAFKTDIFVADDKAEKVKFICGWNSEEEQLAIIYHEGQRKASDAKAKNKASLISINDFYNLNQQLCLLDSSIDLYYPIKPTNTFLSSWFASSIKLQDDVLKSIEQYLYKAVELFGKKLVLALLFDEDESSTQYEENISELKMKAMDDAVTRGYQELDSVLQVRLRSKTLLEVISSYALEDKVTENISVALSELYSFQLQPFIELRELSRKKLAYARDRLKEEIGPNIEKQMHMDLEEWNEQYLIAAEAIQQLYQEYYRKSVNLLLGQRERMLEDQKRFRAEFNSLALPRLQAVEVKVHEEKLKLLNAIKATKEFQRDRVKAQISHAQSHSDGDKEIRRIKREVYEAQFSILESHFEILDEEEHLYKTQLAILNRVYAENMEEGFFFDAVENIEELNEVLDTVPEDPKVMQLKEKLNKISRKRAVLRNKKKAFILEQKRKKEEQLAAKENEKKIVTVKKPEKRTNLNEPTSEKMMEERRKTVQRLKAYKKKAKLLRAADELDDDPPSQYHSLEDLSDAEPSTSSFHVQMNDLDDHLPLSQMTVPVVSLTSLPSLPPPPPPPPLPSISLPTQLNKNRHQNSQKSKHKNDTPIEGPQPVNLNEILAIRSKLKKPSADISKMEIPRDQHDYNSLLQSTLLSIRNVTENSDTDSELESDFNFD